MEGKKLTHLVIALAFCFLALLPVDSHSQPQQKLRNYIVKNGQMQIMLGKNLSKAEVDSFCNRYGLDELPIYISIHTNSFDSLEHLGWHVTINSPEMLVLMKPLISGVDLGNLANKIVYTQEGEEKLRRESEFPVESEKVIYGNNKFLNGKYSFAVKGDDVTFFLRNHLKAGNVLLSGSFNDWNPEGIKMERTDSGWIAHVKLDRGGKYWYKFIVDGSWRVDNDNSLEEEDGYGNTNSVFYKPNHTFRLDTFRNAKNVFLFGSFNNWKPDELRMIRTAGGWQLPLYLSVGTYQYKFVVDGSYYADFKNPEKVPDGHNAFNSVLSIGKPYYFKLAGHADAKRVALSGTFIDWNKEGLVMKKTATGWELPYILRPGNYEYKFIVDGQWITDPGNPLTIDNDANSKNSFLVIEPNYIFHLKGYGSSKSVFVAGDFNAWNGNSLRMHYDGNEWTFNLHLSPGKHKYKFVVDGKWITDPLNKLVEQNDEHTGNSVVWVPR